MRGYTIKELTKPELHQLYEYVCLDIGKRCVKHKRYQSKIEPLCALREKVVAAYVR